MEFKPEDFKNLKYNCYSVPKEKSLLEAFPELTRYTEFTDNAHGLGNDKVIRYVAYMYDKYSPLTSEKNLLKRKMIAVSLAGFEMEDKKYPEEIEQMMLGRNKHVNRVVCCFVRQQRDLQYTSLTMGLTMFYDNISQLNKPSENEADMEELNRKSTLFNHTMKMIATLEETASEVFSGDIQIMYEADEIEQEERTKIKSYPEWIAAQRESGALGKYFKKMEKEGVV